MNFNSQPFELFKIKERITQYAGLTFNKRMDDRLLIAIQQRMKELSYEDLYFYCQKFFLVNEESKQELARLIELLVNLETYFFRDQGQFKILENFILPKIIEKKRFNKILKIWSAGCSKGEEAFSLAILILQLIPNHQDWKITIIGSDISTQALKSARSGIFSQSSFRPPILLHQNPFFFHEHEEGWKVDARVSKLVTFCQKNLVSDPYPTRQDQIYEMDLILCRNVFIYFHKDAVLKAVNKIVDTLTDGGVLIVGHGELQNVHHTLLKKIFYEESAIYQKKTGNSDKKELPDLSNL